jgi:hypothetical protein
MALPARLRASNVAALGSQCQSGKQKACDQLAKIAVEDKNPGARSDAVSQITDQILLAKIALEDPDSDVQEAAVGKLTDQTALEKISLEDPDLDVRQAAVEKLTDQAALEKISLTKDDYKVAQAALQKLTDQSLVFQTALDAQDSVIRSAATGKLTDPLLLSRVAMEGTDATAGSDAVKKLRDQTLLGKIATSAKDPEVRTAAVWTLTNQSLLENAAAADPDEAVRNAAKVAADWKTAQAEHEVYLWKAPADDASAAAKPRWKISAILGAADLGGGIVDSDSSDPRAASFMNMAAFLGSENNPEAASFAPWPFKPESDNDVCDFDSGNLPMQDSGGNQTQIPAPISFSGRVLNGKGIWGVTSGKTTLLFQPKLHISAGGTLALGGTWAAYTDSTGTVNYSYSTMQDVPVIVTGTIRFPPDLWTAAGAGFDILGGGLQFDETGVFLMKGTQYRLHAR